MPKSKKPKNKSDPTAEDSPYQLFKRDALNAELTGSQSIRGLVLQQRWRARRSALTSRIVLFFLLLTVIAGLFFYLAAPLWGHYWDGQRQALEDRKQALETSDEKLDDRRNKLRDELFDILRVETNRTLKRDWSDGVRFGAIKEVGEGVFLVRGDEGTLVRYDTASNTAISLKGDWSDGVSFWAIKEVGEGVFLVRGNQGTLLLYPAPLSESVRKETLFDEEQIQSFVDNLPSSVGALLRGQKIDVKLTRLIGERTPITLQRKQIVDDINGLWTGIFPRAQQRERFEDFMRICRGGKASLSVETPWENGKSKDEIGIPDVNKNSDTAAKVKSTNVSKPDAVTLACTQAWREDLEQEKGLWWQTLATQVPLGVLLLFLLATLTSLYRYNLRLAGFHSSRADMLELVTLSGGKIRADDLIKLSDSMAADKVEFGRANTPVDQAIELVRAVASRKG